MGCLPAHTHPESAHLGQRSPQLQKLSEGERLTLLCRHQASHAGNVHQIAHLGLVLSFHLLAPRCIDNGATNHSVMVREDFSASYSTGLLLETKAIRRVNMESIFHVWKSLPRYSPHFMDEAIEAQRS